MPRSQVGEPLVVERLSILNADGELDRDLEPDLSDIFLRRLHRAMLLARRLDERMLSLQRQGKLGTFAPIRGQEAAQVGAVAALESSDWMVPSYRELAASLWRGTPLTGPLLYNAGYNEGGAVGEHQNDLTISIPVGTQMLHAAGIAYGLRAQGVEDDPVVLTFFGDGATSQGDFHEALNFAAVFDCPVLFVCQNNGYAISTPTSRQTRSRTIAQKAFAYGIPCVQVDGNDVLAVLVACRDGVRRARSEQTPTLIECQTYRLEVHTTVDDPSKYRSDEEVLAWQKRDPIPRFQNYLVERGALNETLVEALEREIEQEIDAAVREAWSKIERLDDPLVIFDHVFAERTPDLETQRAQLEEALGAPSRAKREHSQAEEREPAERANG